MKNYKVKTRDVIFGIFWVAFIVTATVYYGVIGRLIESFKADEPKVEKEVPPYVLTLDIKERVITSSLCLVYGTGTDIDGVYLPEKVCNGKPCYIKEGGKYKIFFVKGYQNTSDLWVLYDETILYTMEKDTDLPPKGTWNRGPYAYGSSPPYIINF